MVCGRASLGAEGRAADGSPPLDPNGTTQPFPVLQRNGASAMQPRRRCIKSRISGACPAYPTLIGPRITAQWPGKLQKNSYGPAPWILLTAKVTDVVCPPPTRSEW